MRADKKEAARICGVSPHIMWYWIQQGRVSVVCLDSTLRIDRLALEKAIQDATQVWTPAPGLADAAGKGHQSQQQRNEV